MLTKTTKAARMRQNAMRAALVLSLLIAGCITSPVWKYGATKEAKQDKLSSCPNGMMDDGEDGDTQIIVADGREGYWYSFVDPWGSTLEPKRFAFQPGGPGNSKMAARMSGTLVKSGESLYAGMGFAFTNPKTPFDISKAKGIRFWGKGLGTVRFRVTDQNTDPQGDRCTDCYNHFGVDITLQDEWIRYTVPFDKMKQQEGYGDRAPELSVKEALAVEWQVQTAGQPYDVWVDEIELMGCSDPEAK